MRDLSLLEIEFVSGGPPQNPPADKGVGPGEVSEIDAAISAEQELARALAELADEAAKRLLEL